MVVSSARGTAPGAVDLANTASSGAIALAGTAETRLGLPVPASRVAARVVDLATSQTVDEVTDLDSSGTPLAVSRFDSAGLLLSSVQLGYAPSIAPAVLAPSVAVRAADIARSVGLMVAGSPTISARATGGWLARWVRLVGSIPVPSDGLSVQLTASGTFHAIVRTEHPLASPPVTTIDAGQARTLAERRLDAWFAGTLRGGATIASLSEAWVAPNDTFGDLVPAGASGALRLAWVVRVTTSGTLADRVAGLELAFDAGDGSFLGGDLLE